MKIGILADPLDNQFAGIHVFAQAFIKALLKEDRKNEYLIVRAEKGIDFSGAKEIVVPIKKNIPLHNRWRQFTSFPKILIDEKVDIALELAHFGPFRLPKNIKRLTFIHDLTPILFPHFHSISSYWSHKMLLPSIFKKADLILCNSKNTEKDVQEFSPDTVTKTRVCYLGKNEEFVSTIDENILKKYEISKKYFLHVGTLEPRKNLILLVKAFNHFRSQNIDGQLVLVGKKGWSFEGLLNEIKNSKYRDDIILCSYVPTIDLIALYSQSIAFVYPSFYEGFGLPIIEAMACACPTIVANNSSLPEVGGNAAVYFDEKSHLDLSAKMMQIYLEPERQSLKNKCIAHANEFTWEKTAKSFIRILDSL